MAYNPNPIVYKLSLTELKDEVPINNRTYVLLGGAAINDVITGVFIYDTASVLTPDDINVVKPTTILLANPGRYIRQNLGGAITARGVFFSSVSVPFTSGVPLVIPLNTNTSLSQYLSHSTSSNTSRIIANKDGFLELLVTLQIAKGALGTGSLDFWLKKNGTVIANSGFRVIINANAAEVSCFTRGASVVAGDYLEVAGQTANANFGLVYTASPGAGIPNIPAISITATLFNNFPS